MQTLALSLRSRGAEGSPLPIVFRQLEDLGAVIRRSQLTLVAAAPGGGKSALATFISLMMRHDDGSPVYTQYFSIDSDKMTFAMRTAAAVFDISLGDAEQILDDSDPQMLEALDEATRHMWVSFDSGPTPRDIDEEVEAFALVFGCYPECIVIDNLMDVSMGPERDDDAVLGFASQLARRTDAAVVVLCHVTGEWTDGKRVIPRSGLINKIDKRPRLIWTLSRSNDFSLRVSVVKNSNGPADSSGRDVMAVLPIDLSRVYFGRGE